jgi:PAS domain S-box-containing protein
LAETKKPTTESPLQFDMGSLTKTQLNGIFTTLPMDVTFIDADDTVRYFNMPKKRIFVRPKTVLGKKVHNCHPQKSLHIVNKIVEYFKNGEKNVAEFWITTNNRFIHIRFFAVRDENGKYLGTMEVVQDLTDIKKLQGERRLLDWTA